MAIRRKSDKGDFANCINVIIFKYMESDSKRSFPTIYHKKYTGFSTNKTPPIGTPLTYNPGKWIGFAARLGGFVQVGIL